MEDRPALEDLMVLLNTAIARELQVSIQYMFQHALGAGLGLSVVERAESRRQGKFVASHSPYFLPGPTLKKIAIAEMRHAEAIAERVVGLGGEPTTQPEPVTIGAAVEEMLENDLEQERRAIQLYGRIVGVARRDQDDVTLLLFEKILSQERQHHRVFSGMLGRDKAAAHRRGAGGE